MKPHLENGSLALASAILLILCFPPFDFGWLGPVALGPLFLAAVRETSPKWRFGIGWAAGIVYWFGVCNWIQFTLSFHGGLGDAGGWAVFVLFAIAKGLHLAVFALLAGWVRRTMFLPVLWAALWTAIESTHGALGFAWLMLGNAAIDLPLPLRLAPVTGVWGISFLFSLTAACLAWAMLRREARQLAWLAVWPALLGLPGLPGVEKGDRMALLVQPDLSETEEWTPQKYRVLEDRLTAMSVASEPVDIVLWPELPAPTYDMDPEFRNLAKRVTTASHAYLLSGDIGGLPGKKIYNSASLFAPSGEEVSRYDKVHLVPFGEFVPWPFGLVARTISTVGSDFDAGTDLVISQMNRHGVASFICYESVFPDFIRRSVWSGAEVLFTPSNDGWFGKTAARFQHLEIVRMRAAENRRWIVRSTNDGISAAIDPAGRIADRAPAFQEITKRVGFRLERETTTYTRTGNVVVWASWVLAAAGLLVRRQ